MIGEPPRRLRVEHLHDRMVVTIPTPLRLGPLTGGLIALCMVGAITVGPSQGIVLAAAILAAGFAAGLGLAHLTRGPQTRLICSDRYVALEEYGEARQILLSDLEQCSVSGVPEDRYLLITHKWGEDPIAVHHRPESELQYLATVVEHACEAYRKREATDGKDYSVDRVVPTAIESLKQRS